MYLGAEEVFADVLQWAKDGTKGDSAGGSVAACLLKIRAFIYRNNVDKS